MFKRKSKYIFKGGNPYQNLEKTSVLQEARTFNDTPVNPRKCTHILSKILYMINQVCISICIIMTVFCVFEVKFNFKLKGEQLGTAEATETFFAMTKLFQSRDIILRRMVYLGIKVVFKKLYIFRVAFKM